MTPNDYYRSLSVKHREAYARKAGLSPDYLRIHLFPKSGIPDRSPSLGSLVNLAEHSDGCVSVTELVEYFSPQQNSEAVA